jgi:hypothetical protein
MNEAEAARVCAMEIKQPGAAVSAVREKAILSGHRIERKEVGPPNSFDNLTDEELARALIERIKLLGLNSEAGMQLWLSDGGDGAVVGGVEDETEH